MESLSKNLIPMKTNSPKKKGSLHPPQLPELCCWYSKYNEGYVAAILKSAEEHYSMTTVTHVKDFVQ